MKKHAKILMIAPTPFFSDRGCHVRIYEEAKSLIKKGHKVVICTYHLGKDMDDIPIIRIPPIPWYNKISAGPSIHKFYLDVLLLHLVLKTTKKFQPDVIYGHLHEGAFLGMIPSKSFNIPLFFDYQGSLTTELVDHHFIKKNSLIYHIFQSIEHIINDRADLIFTSSQNNARNLIKTTHTRVISFCDGVDTSSFIPGEKSPDLIQKYNIPDDKKVVVYLGLLNRYQGIDLLLKSIQLINNQTDQLIFLIMGYPNVDHYRNQAEAYGIDEIVRFTGKIPYQQANRYITMGDIAVSPKISKTEANGKLLNYMACGIPTVCFNSDVNREILGEYGVYAEYNNPESLANWIIHLSDDSKLRNKLSIRLRNRAVTHFDWNNRIQILENALMPFADCVDSEIYDFM